MHEQTIITPYRNRPEHLFTFIEHMSARMPKMPILIVEQCNDKPFNRGRLLNIGALESGTEELIMHDIDMLPLFDAYEPAFHAPVIQFAASKIQLRDYLGGVTMFSADVFASIGGYHNDYFHRAEDNEMMFNLKRLRVPVLEDHRDFDILPHKRTGTEFLASLWRKAQEKRSEQNQLARCEYYIKETRQINNLITHLLVEF